MRPKTHHQALSTPPGLDNRKLVGHSGPSAARLALAKREEFAASAAELATNALGATRLPFKPGRRISTFCNWYVDSENRILAVVIAPNQMAEALDEVLAHALAWQHDRDLLIIIPTSDAAAVLNRLPWFSTPVRLLTYDTDGRLTPAPLPTRDGVLTKYRQLPLRDRDPHVIRSDHRAWVSPLIDTAQKHGAVEVPTSTYVSWHLRGLQILRLASGTRQLNVAAGVQYESRPGGPPHQKFTLRQALVGDQLTACQTVITHDSTRESGRSQTSDPAEHRLQAAMTHRQPTALKLGGELVREFPAWRGPERRGFVDFLGIDAKDELHVIETKIGGDAAVLLQALDYAIWVQANETSIRQRLSWPIAPRHARVHVDLVLGKKLKAGKPPEPGFNPYLAGQIEALAGDVKLRVFTVIDIDADDIELEQVDRQQMWAPDKGDIATPVCQPRWATRVETGLRTATSDTNAAP